MAADSTDYHPPKKMAIITSYFKGETYGLLGPQMAATIIEDHGGCECIVIAVTREDDKVTLKTALVDYFAAQRPIIGFSSLSGREDLFSLAGELRAKGAITILAGPQANVDFSGEKGWRNHPHRFKGFWECFDFGLQGPAEQVVPLLSRLDKNDRLPIPGLLYLDKDGTVRQNLPKEWDHNYLGKVRWDNIYRLTKDGIALLNIVTGQVLTPRPGTKDQNRSEGLQFLRCGSGQGVSWKAEYGNGDRSNTVPAANSGRQEDTF
jgi:hypothetical protein